MPVPVAPSGSWPLAEGVDVVERDGEGVVFVWGMASWCWQAGDEVARRLAAVQLVVTRSAGVAEVAAGFGVSEVTLWRWREGYASGGVAGLVPDKRGPRGPSKLTDAKVDEIRGLRAQGMTRDAIAEAVGVGTGTVSRALAGPAAPVGAEPAAGLEPLARPEPRVNERQAARRGELAEAEPVLCEGASLPLAAALVILPALAVTGLLECFARTYTATRSAFYGVRSLALTVVFAALLREPRAEGLTRLDPVDLGRLLGLDRAPEAKTLRRRMAGLAEEHRADDLLGALARHHAANHDDAMGVLYVDGHVRAYHGKARVPKAHVARIRLSMPAEADTWVADANGDGLLVWQSAPGASLVGELRRVAAEVRDLLGPDRRPTIAFDRGGWSPALFAELDAAEFDILTYRKGDKAPEPRTAFREHRFSDGLGHHHDYLLADRRVRIAYDAGRRRFACRQITRLDPDTGHQTQILTTRTDPDPAPIAHAMFSRWRQENFFRYMRAHYGLDALDAYTTSADDPDRLVANPARKQAGRVQRDTAALLEAAHAEEGRARLGGRRDGVDTTELDAAFADADAHTEQLLCCL